MILFYDTETSGFKERRLLELGMLLLSPDWKQVMALSIIIKPDGWTIEPGALEKHGITLEHAHAVGLPLEMALALFTKFRQLASLVVCHNLSHDYGVMDGELRGSGWPGLAESNTAFFCTMLALTPICKISGPRGFKWPKLMEAYRHAFGFDFSGAHGALSDAKATGEIYRWMVENGHVTGRDRLEPVVPTPSDLNFRAQIEARIDNKLAVALPLLCPPPPPFVPGKHNPF